MDLGNALAGGDVHADATLVSLVNKLLSVGAAYKTVLIKQPKLSGGELLAAVKAIFKAERKAKILTKKRQDREASAASAATKHKA